MLPSQHSLFIPSSRQSSKSNHPPIVCSASLPTLSPGDKPCPPGSWEWRWIGVVCVTLPVWAHVIGHERWCISHFLSPTLSFFLLTDEKLPLHINTSCQDSLRAVHSEKTTHSHTHKLSHTESYIAQDLGPGDGRAQAGTCLDTSAWSVSFCSCGKHVI